MPKPKINSGETGISTTAPDAGHRRRQPHVAGAADDVGERVEQPDQDRAGEHRVRIGERGRQRAAGAAHRGVKRAARRGTPPRWSAVQARAPIATACQTSASAASRRPEPSVRAIADEIPPPIAPADIIWISMTTGKDQRHAGECVGAELGDEIGLDQPDRGLHHRQDDVRPGEPQQRHSDRVFEQSLCSRVHPSPQASDGHSTCAISFDEIDRLGLTCYGSTAMQTGGPSCP